MGTSTETLSTRYLNKGFVHPIDVLDPAEASNHHKRLLQFERDRGSMHYLVKPYLIFSSAWEIASHPLLLDSVESILGPNLLLWDGAYVIKEPHSEGYISWHQDLTYWGLEAESDDDVVSVWLALTQARQENGCMQFVKKSHLGPKQKHTDTYDENNLLHRGQAIESGFEPHEIEHIAMDAGQCSLHHGWAVHSSSPNRSDLRRVALVLNFIKPSVRQRVTDEESATLMRGVDKFKHFRAEPICGMDNAPENLDFQRRVEQLKRKVYDSA